jgi:DNA-binding NtrC family response regulator
MDTMSLYAGETDELRALLHGCKVMCVSDSGTVLARRRMILEAFGCRVQCATDGSMAIGVIKKDPVHLVVVDLRAPGENGELIAINLKMACPGLPVVLVVDRLGNVPASIAQMVARTLQRNISSRDLLHHLVAVLEESAAHPEENASRQSVA